MPMRLTFRAVLRPSHHTHLTRMTTALPVMLMMLRNLEENSLVTLKSNIDGVALFDEDINLIIQHDGTLPRTDNQTGGGTFSLVSHTAKYHTEGTTADVANPRR
eukprot:scaffold73910_cov37-Attheya_sp.AAC.2